MTDGVRAFLLGCAAMLLTTPAVARDLRLVAPIIPPHFDEQGRGRIGDVITAALADCGHTVRFVMVPFGRHWKDYQDNGSLDGLATAEADQTFPGHSTHPFMHLQDGATVVVGRGLEGIGRVEQLSGRTVAAFPGADRILGIGALVPRFASFAMRAERFDQLRPLFAGRVDAILADGLITALFTARLQASIAAGREEGLPAGIAVVFRRIFPPGPQRLYFRDEAVARDFDRCFAALKDSGRAGALARPYVDRFRTILADQYPDL